MRFPIRKIRKIVQINSKEFEIIMNRRKYHLRSSSTSLTSSWVHGLNSVISPTGADGEGSSGEDHQTKRTSTLTGGDASSVVSCGNNLTLNSSGISGETFPNQPLWETPENYSDELDALFSEWFSCLDDPREVKSGRIVDGGSRALSDLWSVLGALPRGEDVTFEESKPKIIKLIKMNKILKLNEIISEYIFRLFGCIEKWLDRPVRSSTGGSDDYPVLIEFLFRLKLQLIEINFNNLNSISNLISKIGSDWEISLIEEINRSILPENYLENFSRISINFLNSSFLVLSSQWTPQFLSLIRSKCLSQSTKSIQWSVAYPNAVDTLEGHSSNVVIAVMNNCVRILKERISKLNKKTESKTKLNSLYSSVKRLSVGVPDENGATLPTTFESLVSLGNEITVISIFCVNLKNSTNDETSLFSNCLDSLSSSLASLAADLGKILIKIHFNKKYSKILKNIFNSNYLLNRIQIPIHEPIEAGLSLIHSLTDLHCHETFRFVLIKLIMNSILSNYLNSLKISKPKLSRFTRLVNVIQEDENLFETTFLDLGRPKSEVGKLTEILRLIQKFLNERNDTPPSRGGIVIIQNLVDIFNSSLDMNLINSLIEIKEINKVDKKDILYALTACVERNNSTPQPPVLNLSQVGDYNSDDED